MRLELGLRRFERRRTGSKYLVRGPRIASPVTGLLAMQCPVSEHVVLVVLQRTFVFPSEGLKI